MVFDGSMTHMSGQRCVAHQRMGGMRTMIGAKRNCVGGYAMCVCVRAHVDDTCGCSAI